ncbi:MAG: hypothetical protein WCL16_04575, partial [bacterium]
MQNTDGSETLANAGQTYQWAGAGRKSVGSRGVRVRNHAGILAKQGLLMQAQYITGSNQIAGLGRHPV